MVVAQFEFGFVSTPLSKLGSFVEGLLWIGEAYKSDLAQTDAAPMMTRLVCSGSHQNLYTGLSKIEIVIKLRESAADIHTEYC